MNGKIAILGVVLILVSSVLIGLSVQGNAETTTVMIFGEPPSSAKILAKYPDGAYLCEVQRSYLNILKARHISYYEVQGLYTISFDFVKIDIRSNTIDIPPELKISGYEGDYGYYIVKLIGPASSEWLSDLSTYGKIYGYIPYYAYLMKIRNDFVQSLKSKNYISWIGLYQPAYKLESRDMLNMKGTVEYTMLLYPEVDRKTVANRLEELGGKVILPDDRYSWFRRINVEIDASQLPRIARMPEVMYIQVMPEFKLTNDVSSRIINVYFAWELTRNRLGLDLDGNGQIVGYADSGLDTGDPSNILEDFQGKIVAYHYYNSFFDTQQDGLGHGTHCAGSIAGSGYLSEVYQGYPTNDDNYDHAICGMAPEAQLVVGEIFTDDGYAWGLQFNSLSTIFGDAYNDGARIHSNSWGAQSNSYDSMAAEVDQFMWDHSDFTVFFAAGNSGPDANTVGSPGTAKDCVTVGASENNRPEYGPNADNINEVASFSSRGPTEDNRIKPDICAPGTWILSTRSTKMQDDISWGHWPWDANNDGIDDYCFMGGTSMATPTAAGAAALIRQYYTDYAGITPSAALIKATMINGAIDMGYGYPSNDQGWGRIDIKNSLFPDPPKTWKYWDVSSGLNTGGTWTQQITVKDSSIPLRITLVWTDYPGEANANPAIVNDLNLKVVSPGGTEYHGNVFSNSWSQPNPSSWDNLNTVENVFVENPETGTWTIEVDGASVSQGPQPFAVVARGALGAQVSYFVALTSTDNWMRIVQPGGQDTFTINVYNYGTNTDTITLSADAPNGITVSFNPSSVTLNSESVQSVGVTVSVSSSVSDGAYDLTITGTSSGNSNVKDQIVFKVVVRSSNPPSSTDFSSEPGGQGDFDIFVKGNTVYIAYVSGENGGKTIYLRYSSDGINWQKEQVSSGTGCEEPDIIVDDNNDIVVVWKEGTDIKLRYKSSGSWSAEKVLGSASDSNYPMVDEPTIAQDSSGYIWVFYKDLSVSNNVGYWNIKYVKSSSPNDPGSFSSPSNAPFTDTSMADYITDAYRASDGTLWVAYYQRDPNANPSYRVIRYAKYDGSNWDYGNVESSSQGDNYYAGIFEDSQGRIWFAWYSTRGGSGYQIYMAYYSSGSWSSTIGPIGTSTPYSPSPSMIELPDGSLAIVYIEYDNPYGAGNVIVAKSTDDFATYTTDYITMDGAGKSEVKAVVMNNEVWYIYSAITFKGGEWSGMGEQNANNDADLYIVVVSAVPEFEPFYILILFGLLIPTAFLRRKY